jgi:hypothetical protein
MFQQGTPETRQGCPLPPYNTLNFTSASPIYQTLTAISQQSPNYPLPPSADAGQIANLRANLSYYQAINQQALVAKSTVQGGIARFEYPKFKTEGDRLKYRQGLMAIAARGVLNPSAVIMPVSTLWQIIN